LGNVTSAQNWVQPSKPAKRSVTFIISVVLPTKNHLLRPLHFRSLSLPPSSMSQSPQSSARKHSPESRTYVPLLGLMVRGLSQRPNPTGGPEATRDSRRSSKGEEEEDICTSQSSLINSVNTILLKKCWTIAQSV
jgi:hypothetical protein